MTIRVELSEEAEARLKDEARVKGLPLEKLAEKLLSDALSGRSLPQGRLSIEEFHQMLDTMATGSGKLPDLSTESFSRESFYEDRVNGGDAVPRR